MSQPLPTTELEETTLSSGSIRSDSERPLCCGMMRCCGGGKWFLGLLLIAGITGAAVVAFFVGRSSALGGSNAPLSMDAFTLPAIDATAAVASDNFAIATGHVAGEVEGLFVLDNNTGLLQCAVIYPRIGRFAANFTANVGDALASRGKGSKYLMVTGIADFRQASNNPMGQSVVYVLDSSTGNYACYAIPFSRVMMNANQPQTGPLQLIAVGNASPVIDRDRR